MDLKLGRKIAAFRKEKGMTQEQLAQAVGVSAPAVSKWETDSSYPDITILCPLARALGTDVDTLLEYEEVLSEERVGAYADGIVRTARERGVEEADDMLQGLLHQYPNSVALKYYGASLLTAFETMFSYSGAQETRERWKRQKEKLLQEVCAGGASEYFRPAVSLLVTEAIADGELDKAEQLLEELPGQEGGETFLWIQLYLKRGETAKAKETVQRRLFTLVGQVQACLALMMGEKLEPDVEKEIEICDVYRQMEEIFRCGGNMGDGHAMEIYQRAGEEEKMLQSMVRFIDRLAEPMAPPNPLLFSPTISSGEERYITKEIRQVVLASLRTEEAFDGVREDGRFLRAVEKLSRTLENEKTEMI